MAELLAEQIKKNLRTRIIGRTLYTHTMVISTNDVLWELDKVGAEEGTVVIAEEQTKGRGRLGRSWWSPRGSGIWMSVLFKPEEKSHRVRSMLPEFTIMSAVAVADAVRKVTKLDALIRWPNDVIIARNGKKIAGVLAETKSGSHSLVMGIGLDVNSKAADMPADIAAVATSLSEEMGRPADRLELCRALLKSLDEWYRVRLDGGYELMNARWRELSSTLGKHIALEEKGRRYSGTVIDLDVRDGIALRLERGQIKHFRGEHVSVIKHGGS